MDKYTVSKVKIFQGREGYGFNAVLHRNGIAVADVINDASGGPVRFGWRDAASPRVTFQGFNEKDELVELTGTAEEALFVAHCRSRGTYESYGMTLRYSPDVVAEELAFDADERKRITARLKRLMKTQVLFIEKGKEYYCKPKKVGTDPLTLVDGVKQRHPGATILNLLPIEEAIEQVLKASA